MSWIPGSTAIENTRALAQSALPDAPQIHEPDPIPRRAPATSAVRSLRARLSATLRATARHELALADRLDPNCTA
ncbi:hypothetical protein OG394_32885 [Kribbella sp. NBC_01245]|uniref:hypothetical protein n=1 Tax=Kribbella sp. NBC_01245 TaxID=2903578 RepID=UPI002E2D60CD|nr:hypothetical protein [Kribbella sp. NBC_01245]